MGNELHHELSRTMQKTIYSKVNLESRDSSIFHLMVYALKIYNIWKRFEFF